MNVTLKLPDSLCRKARHRAVDQSQSLSAWVAKLVERELTSPAAEPKTLIEATSVPDAPEWFYDKEFPVEDRGTITVRDFSFENE